MRKNILFISALCVLIFFNFTIYSKEKSISQGQTILSPKDPRSLMQGDYMALDYVIADEILAQEERRNHKQAILIIDQNNVATFAALKTEEYTLSPNEILLNYAANNNRIQLPLSRSYFFEEGSANKYENAIYGVFKYYDNNYLLIGLANADAIVIK